MDPLKIAKATIVTSGAFGANVVHAKDVEITITIRPWAQYARALSITYVEKGARKRKGVVFYHPDTLPFVLEGWHAVPLPDPFERRADGTTITKHASFSPEIGRETREACERFLSANPAIKSHVFEI